MESVDAKSAIVRPFSWPGAPKLPPLAVMACIEPDLKRLVKDLGFSRIKKHRLIAGSLYAQKKDKAGHCLAGPLLGAPQAAIVMEQLMCFGARQFVFFGWCGSLSPELTAGDILVPTSAFVDEGTSAHYPVGTDFSDEKRFASKGLSGTLKKALKNMEIPFSEGAVWTTDALFRETPEKVDSFSEKGALAVDMELSALFSVASFYNVDLAGILVVSDELFTGTWRSGVADKAFDLGRKEAARGVCELCRIHS